MRLLVTAGPTREYLDDVRYLSNASSGRMGYALVEAGLALGWEVVLVSGPVEIRPPKGCELIPVVTTAEMRDAAVREFPTCQAVIAAAAVCDYRPRERVMGKLSKTGEPIILEMIETDDVLAELGRMKESRRVIGFALEAQNPRENALQKLRRKNCDWIVLNRPEAIGSESNSIELMDQRGETIMAMSGSKSNVAAELINWLAVELKDDLDPNRHC